MGALPPPLAQPSQPPLQPFMSNTTTPTTTTSNTNININNNNNSLYNVLLTNGPSTPTNNTTLNSSDYNTLTTQNNGEDISTIFVVGFPDDMQEREFQNMFIFSPGFEAATLKIPSKDLDDDLPTPTTNGNNGRKQIIGFAKFRTRHEALEARDIISGRKVDAEKGSVLKAEMAKKNLHTKRGLSSEQQKQQQQHAGAPTQNPVMLAAAAAAGTGTGTGGNGGGVPPPLPTGGIVPVPTQSYSQQQQKRYPSTPYEAFYSVPLPVTSPEHHPLDFNFPDHRPALTDRAASMGDIYNLTNNNNNGNNGNNNHSNGNNGNGNSSGNRPSLFGHRYSLFDMESSATSPPPIHNNGADMVCKSIPPPQHQQHQQQTLGTTAPQPLSSVFEDVYQQQPSPPLPQPSLSASSSHHLHHHHPPPPSDLSAALNARLNGLSINTTSPVVSNGGLPSPPGVTSPNNYRSLLGTFGGSAASMDQNNPPCNTLYVGNLPPNTSEDELRMMFAKCIGFKRLSFKSKANNGPMCFVEFEDVACATQALHELYGNPLSNSVKGGIRLSFSKNPLGVRQPSFPGTYRRESLSIFDVQ
ncbi:hypothetical protein INT45_002146 [Circinella minor]|uniref:RRM domain-containing protein n=1 Tax=Circinella minor TaxID=1195481 RepID=A0A8H7SGX6_9FUNG|nr:hypothetical protein INT45_002146 [Circinella minor]